MICYISTYIYSPKSNMIFSSGNYDSQKVIILLSFILMMSKFVDVLFAVFHLTYSYNAFAPFGVVELLILKPYYMQSMLLKSLLRYQHFTPQILMSSLLKPFPYSCTSPPEKDYSQKPAGIVTVALLTQTRSFQKYPTPVIYSTLI